MKSHCCLCQRRRPMTDTTVESKLKKKKKKARWEFATVHIDKPQSSEKNVLWTDKTKCSFLARTISSMFTDAKMKHSKKRTLSLL